MAYGRAMTEPTYHIEPDVPGKFLRIVMAGDWNPDITARFADDVAQTLRTMLATGLRHGELRTLIDMREKHVLPQTVAAEFAKMVRPDSPSKRIALIVSSAIHRLQAKRIADARQSIFDSEEAALDWLGVARPPAAGATESDLAA